MSFFVRYETKLTFLTSHQSEIDVFITDIEITSLWPEIFLAVVMLFKKSLVYYTWISTLNAQSKPINFTDLHLALASITGGFTLACY